MKKSKKKAAPREGVPPFAATFPRDAELDALVDAFVRGDYAFVREAAPRLAERTEDGAIREAALTLRQRIDPDPLGRTLIVVAAALLAFLAWWYLAHAHGQAG